MIKQGTKCLACSVLVDMGGDLKGNELVPRDGDITICFYCGHIMAYDVMTYDDKNSLRELTSEEMHEIAGSPALLHAQKMRYEAYQYFLNAKKEVEDGIKRAVQGSGSKDT